MYGGYRITERITLCGHPIRASPEVGELKAYLRYYGEDFKGITEKVTTVLDAPVGVATVAENHVQPSQRVPCTRGILPQTGVAP